MLRATLSYFVTETQRRQIAIESNFSIKDLL